MAEHVGRITAQAFEDAGINFVASVPDSWLGPVIQEVASHPGIIHIGVSREDEGLGLLLGGTLAGRRGALVIQSAGLLNCMNYLAHYTTFYELPCLLYVSHRAAYGPDQYYQRALGPWVEDVLRVMRIRYRVVHHVQELADAIKESMALAAGVRAPVALLLTRPVFYGTEEG